MSFVITRGTTAGYPIPYVAIAPGDKREWIPRGQIRSDYDDPVVLANWSFNPMLYDPISDTTSVEFWLPATESARLPLPRQWERVGVIRRGFTGSRFVTDIEISHPTDPRLVIRLHQGSLVEVLPEVTDAGEDPEPPPTVVQPGQHPASANLSALRVVRLNSTQQLEYASPVNHTAIAGVLPRSVITGELVAPVLLGPLSDESWNWDISLPIYLGSDGFLSQLLPVTGAIVMVGYALAPTQIQVSIDQPIHQEVA